MPLRQRDALLLPGGAPSLPAGAAVAALLGAAVVLAADAPEVLPPCVSAPLRVGPALFDGGGLGTGLGRCF